jgi:hypothetical protein
MDATTEDIKAALENYRCQYSRNEDEWLTPPELIRALGPFDLDPCSPINRPWSTAEKHYTIEDDGLNKNWNGRIWCNPPYGKETFKWLEKLANHGNGIALIFARTETIGFHREIWGKADSIFFFKGRLKFHHVSGTQAAGSNAPSCLVSYSWVNTIFIKAAMSDGSIDGSLVRVEQLS